MNAVAPANERPVRKWRRVCVSGIGGPVFTLAPRYRDVVRTGRATSPRRCAASHYLALLTPDFLLLRLA